MTENMVKLRLDNGAALHFCPGCDQLHAIPVAAPPYPIKWEFNGSTDAPTFNPSVRHQCEYGDGRGRSICHYFIRDGKIEYCGDSTHALAGQTVDLPANIVAAAPKHD